MANISTMLAAQNNFLLPKQTGLRSSIGCSYHLTLMDLLCYTLTLSIPLERGLLVHSI
jgi:hypothetical protein